MTPDSLIKKFFRPESWGRGGAAIPGGGVLGYSVAYFIRYFWPLMM